MAAESAAERLRTRRPYAVVIVDGEGVEITHQLADLLDAIATHYEWHGLPGDEPDGVLPRWRAFEAAILRDGDR